MKIKNIIIILFMVLITLQLAFGVDNNTILYYSFDNGEWNQESPDYYNIADTFENSNATGYKTQMNKTGIFNESVFFTNTVGVDYKYINIDENLLDTSSGFSINVWINTGYSGDVNKQIFSIYGSSGVETPTFPNNYLLLYIGGNSSKKGKVSYEINGYGTITSNTLVNDSEWRNVIATFSPNETKLYIDGILEGNLSITGGNDFNSSGRVMRIGTHYSGGYSQQFFGYIDEFKIINKTLSGSEALTEYNRANELPYVIFSDPIPNPQNISENVRWSISIANTDDPNSEILSAFDCNNNGTLDYSWDYRGVGMQFNCSYENAGNYTGKAWTSDDTHFPTNNSFTDTVEIYLMETNETGTGTSCENFTQPTCLAGEFFCDDFSYTNPILCNDWDGTAKNIIPTSNELHIFGLNVVLDGYDIEYNLDNPIIEDEYNTFSVEFDFTIDSDHVYQFDILNEANSEYLLFMQWNDYILTAYDQISPTTLNLGTFNGTTHNFKAVLDFTTELITYYIDGNETGTGNFYDSGITNANEFGFSWVSNLQDFTIDNFKINAGDLNPTYNETEYNESLTTDYNYNPNFFCAIDWDNSKFSEQNCADRGYNTEDQRIALCVPKACISDIVSALYVAFIDNILVSIVIIAILILIIPLFIAMAKKKK